MSRKTSYVQVNLWEHGDGTWGVSIGEFEPSPRPPYRRTLHRPWEHTYTMPVEVGSSEVFRVLKEAIEGLRGPHPWDTTEGGSASPEGTAGATGRG